MNENDSPHPLTEVGYEKHDVSVIHIVGFAVICITLIVLGIFMVDGYFVYTKEKLINEANKVSPKELMELRAKHHETLSTYKVIDESKGVYQIPISQAMKLLSEKSFEKHSKP